MVGKWYDLSPLIDIGHVVYKSKFFKVTYRIPDAFSCGIRPELLHVAKAIGFRADNPSL